jgi:hypothetical protein
MTHYYLLNRNAPRGFEEITEEEYLAVVGLSPVREYAEKVYRGRMSIADVPEEHREKTQAVVDAKIARLGVYEIPDAQALHIITGGEAE